MNSVVSFVSAAVLGATVSGSVALVRAGQGHAPSVVAVTMALVWAALIVYLSVEFLSRSLALSVEPASWSRHLAAQAAGLTAASVTVHLVFTHVAGVKLVECPGQFVNDAALSIPVLAIAWSEVLKNRKAAALLGYFAVVLMAFYAATKTWWHFDPFPGAAVQQFVTVEGISICAALWVFSMLRATR